MKVFEIRYFGVRVLIFVTALSTSTLGVVPCDELFNTGGSTMNGILEPSDSMGTAMM